MSEINYPLYSVPEGVQVTVEHCEYIPLDQTAVEMLNSTLYSYNETVSHFFKFKLNKRETKMFSELMERFASQEVNRALRLRNSDTICGEKWLNGDYNK